MGCGGGKGVRLWIFGGSELAAGASPGTTEMDNLYRDLRWGGGGILITAVYMCIVLII